jgi:hypothetical protein
MLEALERIGGGDRDKWAAFTTEEKATTNGRVNIYAWGLVGIDPFASIVGWQIGVQGRVQNMSRAPTFAGIGMVVACVAMKSYTRPGVGRLYSPHLRYPSELEDYVWNDVEVRQSSWMMQRQLQTPTWAYNDTRCISKFMTDMLLYAD